MKKISLIGLVLIGMMGTATQSKAQAVDSSIFEVPQITNWLDEFDPYQYLKGYTPSYKKVRVPTQSAWSYPHLREADVSFARRYHRIIDCRQKMNKPLMHPKNSFFKLMFSMALSGDIPMYHDYDFQEEMTRKEMKLRATYPYTVSTLDPVTLEPVESTGREAIPLEEMHKIRLVEEHIFDKKHSVMKPRLIGFAILYSPRVAEGQVKLAEQPLMWMKYDDIRGHLVNHELFNKRNEAAQISYDHFFQARMFDSYIVKEPNVNDLDIKYYSELEDNGLCQLLKSEEIKNDLFVTEHDLWEY